MQWQWTNLALIEGSSINDVTAIGGQCTSKVQVLIKFHIIDAIDGKPLNLYEKKISVFAKKFWFRPNYGSKLRMGLKVKSSKPRTDRTQLRIILFIALFPDSLIQNFRKLMFDWFFLLVILKNSNTEYVNTVLETLFIRNEREDLLHLLNELSTCDKVGFLASEVELPFWVWQPRVSFNKQIFMSPVSKS